MRLGPSSRTHLRRFAWASCLVVVVALTGVVTLSLRGVDILGLVAAATSSLSRSPVILEMLPYHDRTLDVGEAEQIDVIVDTEVPINAIGTTITFPKDSVEVLGFSKEKSFFDLWTEETAIDEDDGAVHF